MDKNYLTPKGYKKASKLLEEYVKVRRPESIEAISEAQQNGGGELSENSEYLQALKERDQIENKILELSKLVDNCQVIDISNFKEDNKVRFGSTVTLFDIDLEKEFTYTIVGEIESDIREGTISYKSPIGNAMIGLNKEDEFDLVTPSGIRTLEVIEVKHLVN